MSSLILCDKSPLTVAAAATTAATTSSKTKTVMNVLSAVATTMDVKSEDRRPGYTRSSQTQKLVYVLSEAINLVEKQEETLVTADAMAFQEDETWKEFCDDLPMEEQWSNEARPKNGIIGSPPLQTTQQDTVSRKSPAWMSPMSTSLLTEK